MRILNFVLYGALGGVLALNGVTFVTPLYWVIMGIVVAIDITSALAAS